jgi:hypothetical protein
MGWDGKFRSFFILSPSLPLSLVVVLVPALVVLVGIFFFSKGYRLEREGKREKKNRHSREEEEEEEEEDRLTTSEKSSPPPSHKSYIEMKENMVFQKEMKEPSVPVPVSHFILTPIPTKGEEAGYSTTRFLFFPFPPFPLLRSLITTLTRISRSPIFLFPSRYAAMVL